VGLHAVADLVTHSRTKNLHAAILQLSVKFTLQTQEDVTLFAPVVCQVARRVVNDSYSNVTELPRAPMRYTRFPIVCDRFHGCPVGGLELNIPNLHMTSIMGFQPLMPGPVMERTFRWLGRKASVQQVNVQLPSAFRAETPHGMIRRTTVPSHPR